MRLRNFALATSFILFQGTALFAADDWKETLKKELPLLGHRNWIVVADAAYPLQTSPGVETICADADQLKVVRQVLAAVASTSHVRPTILMDSELKWVTESSAPGVGAYRDALAKFLEPTSVLPHEQIIAKLDEAGKTFKVLLIKTPLAIPYTSVFFQLECGYWDAEKEKALREAMKASAAK